MKRRDLLTSLSASALAVSGCLGVGGDGLSTDEATTSGPNRSLDPVNGKWPTHQFDMARTGHLAPLGTSHEDRNGRWRAQIDPRSGTPAIVEGTVYTGSVKGTVYALEATTGEQVWRSSLISTKHMHWKPPSVAARTVYMVSQAPFNQAVYALDAETGEKRWEFSGVDDHFTGGDLVVVDDLAIVSADSTTIIALDTDIGDVRWQHNVGEHGIGTNLAVTDGRVFFLTVDNTAFALDVTTGEKQWELPVEGAHRIRDVAVSEGRVIFTSDTIHGLDTTTGEQQWIFSTVDKTTEQVGGKTAASLLPMGRVTASGGPQASAPAIARGTVYVKTEEEEFVALEASTGQLEWSANVAGPPKAPVVAGDLVYVSGKDTIQTYDAASGEPADWVFSAQGSIGAPVVVDGVVFVETGSGGRYLEALTGEKRFLASIWPF